MTASLPMYDWPEVRSATDALWRGVAGALRAEGLADVPDALVHDGDIEALWRAPALLLSQTCGYPLTHAWAGKLQVLATPHYDAEGCEAADYCSFVIARRDDGGLELDGFRGTTAAYNSEDSQSGYSALRAVIAPLAKDGRFFGATRRSGGHLKSLQMVASGEADLCAVDAIVWAQARRHHGDLCSQLRAITRSPLVPGLPYVTSVSGSPDRLQRLRAGLRAAFDASELSDVRRELMLCGLSVLDDHAYQRILEMERDSAARGYATVK